MKLLTIFITAVLVATPLSAFATGYNCVSVDRDTRIDVLTDVLSGTPGSPQLARKVIVLDPNLSVASQITATFELADGLVTTEVFEHGYRFISKVDLSFPGSARGGRKLGGTVLSALKDITLAVHTVTKRQPIQILKNGTIYAAEVVYSKNNGQELKQDFDCQLILSAEAADRVSGN